MNRWQEIWNKRSAQLAGIDRSDKRAMLLELKRINGFDVTGGGIPYESLLKQYEETKAALRLPAGGSIFEVGCGAGANLWLFRLDGFAVGGLDYSEKLISIMKDVFAEGTLRESLCDEAKNLPTKEKYDGVLANSVFSYFRDESYAETVLEKMLEKTCGSIVLLDVHDAEKRADFLSARRMIDPDYDERYKNLDKFFYQRSFFDEFAKKHDLSIVFADSTIEGYWNNPFIYHVYFHRKEESER